MSALRLIRSLILLGPPPRSPKSDRVRRLGALVLKNVSAFNKTMLNAKSVVTLSRAIGHTRPVVNVLQKNVRQEPTHLQAALEGFVVPNVFLCVLPDKGRPVAATPQTIRAGTLRTPSAWIVR